MADAMLASSLETGAIVAEIVGVGPGENDARERGGNPAIRTRINDRPS
jgi:hypothetical protein